MAATEPPLHERIARDVFAARIARLVESLPPAEVSPDLRAQAEALRLLSSASAAFSAPAGEPAALAQAAVDHLRALRLRDIVGDGAYFPLGVAPAILAALRAAAAAGAGGAPEVSLLSTVEVVGQTTLWANTVAPHGSFEGADAQLARVLGSLRNAIGFWADASNAARLAARLAELGVARGEAAAAAGSDAHAAAVKVWARVVTMQGGAAAADALEEAVAADPYARAPRATLIVNMLETAPRRAYDVARAGVRRAERGGYEFTAALFSMYTLGALMHGARGESCALGELRSLVARARAGYDRSRAAVPRGAWAASSAALEPYEATVAHFADLTDEARVPAAIMQWGERGPLGGLLSHRTCSSCHSVASEMLQCACCRAAWYCSPACQRAHWPEHREACSAAAAARGG